MSEEEMRKGDGEENGKMREMSFLRKQESSVFCLLNGKQAKTLDARSSRA